ncbi:MAG: tetratricopeptide (TPR) repeat protein [Crocinitomicaceae bacterium]|jgi:tetratricopeptide (TPR) repeat protein
MKARTIILAITFSVVGTFGYSQEKETVKGDNIDNIVTISSTGMYDGTESEEAQKYFDQAEKYAREGDLDNAKKSYLKAIKKDSEYVEAYDNLGLVYRKMGEYGKAIEYYKKSVKLYPEGTMAHQNLAVVYGILKDYDSAISEYDAMLNISDTDPEAYFGMANSYMMLSQFDYALENAEKALELYQKAKSPHLADGYYMLGIINYYKGDKQSARKNLLIAQDMGTVIHPQIVADLFTEEEDEKEEIQLKTDEDYEQDVIDGYNWLMETPIGTEPAMRKEISAFIVTWLTSSPNVTVELSDKIVTYMDCGDCLIMFMGGWTKYALESKEYDNKVKGNLAGTEDVIKFYLLNKDAIGKNKAIEKLIELQKKNELESFIKSNI